MSQRSWLTRDAVVVETAPRLRREAKRNGAALYRMRASDKGSNGCLTEKSLRNKECAPRG
jgi:hypothetical protein